MDLLLISQIRRDQAVTLVLFQLEPYCWKVTPSKSSKKVLKWANLILNTVKKRWEGEGKTGISWPK